MYGQAMKAVVGEEALSSEDLLYLEVQACSCAQTVASSALVVGAYQSLVSSTSQFLDKFESKFVNQVRLAVLEARLC
jgi:vacuolar-type H+-ATPase subunit B/Vma2